MPLTVVTDHAALSDVLDRLVAADPVRHTVLGTIRLSLTDSAWAAVHGSSAVAVRSSAADPVVLAGPWPDDARELRAALAAVPDLAGLTGPEPLVTKLLGLLGPHPQTVRERLHRLDTLITPAGVAGRARVAGPTDRDRVRAWWSAFAVEAFGHDAGTAPLAERAVDDGSVRLWLDPAGTPVSMAARRPVIGGSARIGPVYTPPAHRGHGYGSAVTAAATRSILDDGGVPVLFTDLANPTSNKIYAALGYYPVEDRVAASRSSQAA